MSVIYILGSDYSIRANLVVTAMLGIDIARASVSKRAMKAGVRYTTMAILTFPRLCLGQLAWEVA